MTTKNKEQVKQPFYSIGDKVYVKPLKVKGVVKGHLDGLTVVTYFIKGKRRTNKFDLPLLRRYTEKQHKVSIKLSPITIKSSLLKFQEELKRKGFTKSRFSSSNQSKKLQIKVKYFTDIEPLQKISKGDWIDLRSAINVEMKAGEYKLIPLGVGMKLPEGYEANPVPRSSTFKNFGIIQANHIGVIDNSYSGNDDQWHFPAIALRNTIIKKNDRICQFRIQEVMPEVELITVDVLDDISRGGFGSTGVQ
ncbi:hypothetical protein IAQ67_15855 [Paenibacillus peoriae]|uniref:dUTP diphosphatase n=1 Tax=Paenibacillus peoriae TaxID=59893 RepID=A0A7H0Y2R1_9BACL|nr:hypothetical protein IAQ67_15855 [Paenibacillus peoriae]